MPDRELRTRPARRTWAVLFVLIALALVAGGYLYYQREAGRIRQEKYHEIAAIAELKAGQVLQWRKERLADAERVAKSPTIRKATAEFLRDPATPGLRADLRERLNLELMADVYADVLLLSPDGNMLLAAKDDLDPVGPATKLAIEAALADRKAVLSEFYRCPRGEVYVDAVAPILDTDGRPTALFVLSSDAAHFLYPLIQSWPTPSPSAETLLVRRDGEELVYLNELRHRAGTALSLREPLGRSDLPAVQAVLGKQGMFEGKDYRGVTVLADLRPIPGTPWFMVAKVDTDEILAEARYRAGVITILVIVFVLLAAVVTAFTYRHRQAGLYRALYQAEREQREEMEEFRTTLYSIGDAVISTDKEGQVREMNPVAEQLTGWPRAEAQGKPLGEVFHIINEETRATVENPVHRVLREGVVVGLANHTVLIARDGTERPVADSGAPVRDESGSVIGVVLVFRDQTKERTAQKALATSEALLNAAQRLAKVGGWEWDVEKKTMSWTEETYRIHDFVRGEIPPGSTEHIDRSLECYDPEDRPVILATFRRCAEEGQPYDLEVPFTTAKGRRLWIRTAAQPVLDHGRIVRVIGNIVDMTERKLAEEVREKLEAQLRQSQKMETVGRLAGGVAHDFNNVLTGIIGYAEFAHDSLGENAPAREDIAQIMSLGKRAAGITQQLLAFARRQTLQLAVCNINTSLGNLGELLRPLIGEDIGLRFFPTPDLGNVQADAGQIEQVLMNLAVNARDAMPNGGKLTIETANASLDQTYANERPEVKPGEYVMIAVTDTGCGMDEAARARLFEPFFTTKDRGKGTGLGLATTYGIVKQHGGHIWVYSEPGKGTCFKIYLPRVYDAVEQATSPAGEPIAERGEGGVLVVEDEAAICNVVARVLTEKGYKVVVAASPGEAQEQFAAHQQEIRLLLTDVVLPGANGRELYEQCVKLKPSLRVLYMSGYTENAIAHRGVLDAGTAFIRKPFTSAELLRKVRQVLAS